MAGQLDQLVVEEGHPALQAPRHRHVVDALDRVVHQHHGRVEPQRAVDARRRACTGEVLGDELSTRIPVGAVWSATYRLRDVSRCDERRDTLTVAVEERLAVAGHRAVDGGGVGLTHRGIPVVAGEHLIGALPGLHDLDVFGHFLAEQIEGDAVVADHRLTHRADRTIERGQHAVGSDADLVVIGAEALGDDV